MHLADHDVGVIVCVHWGQISPQEGGVGGAEEDPKYIHPWYCLLSLHTYRLLSLLEAVAVLDARCERGRE